MKLLITILLLFTVFFASAQEDKKEINIIIPTIEAPSIDLNQEVVISVKGIKTMDEIDIENYNKTSYLNLIANKKQEPEMC
ncbi:hypothetical protein [Lacinutrix sp. Hel_I_90]|uniref:hypothetical protein n=1 Tax=Lacinutrix sp. Hel_I_90 TaxID=1249999 RepID=UPI0005CA03D4|nr:hypothetical protein [Lacinutrix sp. Hel_I_90]